MQDEVEENWFYESLTKRKRNEQNLKVKFELSNRFLYAKYTNLYADKKRCLSLSPPNGPYGPKTNIVKGNFSGGKVQNIVNVLMAVFYNSLCFHLIYFTMLPLKIVDLYGF